MATFNAPVAVRIDDSEGRQPVKGGGAVGLCRAYAKRSAIFHQGDPVTHLYRVESGAVALELFLEDGRRQLAEILLPGDFCGFAIEHSYHETAIALQPTVLSVMRQCDLERAGMSGWDVARQAGRQIVRTHDHLLALGRKTAQERICQLLLRLARVIGDRPFQSPRACHGPIRLNVPLTRGEMGDYLGLSLETVCRTMSALQKQGIIEVGPRQGDVTVRAPELISLLAG
ncbi:MAG: helix-turn-helix domain-containing protein [Bosea sp.]|jgi:CRP-like cAMP-binding protein|nr:helix-turn-helix domain-containing protein [Bosea sp. (in: a-proteobacteria)]